DVLKALALGAKFVFAGRPFAYAAAVGGAAGVDRAITLLLDELQRDMAMLGISRLSELSTKRLFRFNDTERAGLPSPANPAH
ncbi:MAG TPA: alpha-hydroxy-acid oxidizing protein, partial [Casimicrobiaceae bacterium]|nr:alpha-hydroxy-acid oxidizing protein [Casimicrobiaceae bacterium]